MKNTADLRQKFQNMIRWRRNVSVCRILTEMLDRGELRYHTLETKGTPVEAWFSNGSVPVLDNIAQGADLVELELLKLFAAGCLAFDVTDDCEHGLDITWICVKDPRPRSIGPIGPTPQQLVRTTKNG